MGEPPGHCPPPVAAVTPSGRSRRLAARRSLPAADNPGRERAVGWTGAWEGVPPGPGRRVGTPGCSDGKAQGGGPSCHWGRPVLLRASCGVALGGRAGGPGARWESGGRALRPTPTPRRALHSPGQTAGLRAGVVPAGERGLGRSPPGPSSLRRRPECRRRKPPEEELETKDARSGHGGHGGDPGERPAPGRPPRLCPASGPRAPPPLPGAVEGGPRDQATSRSPWWAPQRGPRHPLTASGDKGPDCEGPAGPRMGVTSQRRAVALPPSRREQGPDSRTASPRGRPASGRRYPGRH